MLVNGNGTAKNGSSVKTEKPEVNTTSTLVVKQEKPKEQDELKPLEDRILKVQMLGDLVERREKLIETSKKLNSFKVSTDGNRDKLVINDSKGNEFLTSNTLAIKEVIEFLKTSILKQIAETEAQIIL